MAHSGSLRSCLMMNLLRGKPNNHFLWVSLNSSINGDHPSRAEACGVMSMCAIVIFLPVYHEDDDQSGQEHWRGFVAESVTEQ